MKNLLPIRKIAVGAAASGLYYGAHKLGLTFTNKNANDAGQGLVGFAVAYILPDPRVQKLGTKIGLWAKLRALNGFLTQAATPSTASPVSVVQMTPADPAPPAA